MRAGLASAGSGAKALEAGAGRARNGIGKLHGGLAEARAKERAGAPQVARLANGLDEGGRGLGQLRQPVQTADDQLGQAWKLVNLMTTGRTYVKNYTNLATAIGTADAAMTGKDPRNGKPVKDGYDGMDATLAEAFVYISLTQYVDHFLAYAETENDVPAAPSFAHAHD